MSWLEWVGLISLAVHGSLGFVIIFFALLDRVIRNTDFAKSLLGYWFEKCKRERDV